ncbi:transcriptional regulator [Corynebacterium sp. 13CS0277]|uniref:ArsR/SmtB family transcription factor n=1 Tax=Corynebacterium sp. 13CS0277 TaxID=2071994 RepID=UPI000D037799|nr:metalloregulator ArsR/SmtB family transcription factor [Corynebacterium sp. 13CS0277]PRQ10901.1 transcriptional regulator [Corynebacterium sp. 13CS0277]
MATPTQNRRTITNTSEHRLDDTKYIQAAELIHALHSPLRLKIVHLLAEQDLCVHEIVQILGANQPLVSQHLKVLKDAGVVDAERQGREQLYTLTCPASLKIMRTALSASGEET